MFLYIRGQWLEVSGLPERSYIAACVWSADARQLAVVADTIPASLSEPSASYLLLISAEAASPSVSAQIQPPPGHVLASATAVSWLGSSHILVGLSSEASVETYAYLVGND